MFYVLAEIALLVALGALTGLLLRTTACAGRRCTEHTDVPVSRLDYLDGVGA